MKTLKRNFGLVAIIILLISSSEFVKGQDKKIMTRDVSGATNLIVNGNTTIYLTQGNEDVLTIEGDSSALKGITTKVSDGTLNLTVKGGKALASKLTLSLKNYNKIVTSGATSIKTVGKITSNDLKIVSSGASDIDMEINAENLKVVASGASDIKLIGVAKEAYYNLSGASNLKANDLATDKAKVICSGASDAKVNVETELFTNTSGAGNYSQKGKALPKELGNISVKIDGVDSLNFSINENGCSDTTKHKQHKDKPEIYWGGFSMGINGFLSKDNKFDLPAGYSFMNLDYSRSFVFNINILEKNFSLVKNHLNVVTGLGFEFNNYRFDNNYKLLPDTNMLVATLDTTVKFTKNTLNTTYLNVPLLLQFDTKKDKHGRTFHVSAGVVGGLRLGSHTKQKYEVDGDTKKSKTKDDFNLSTLRYSAMARIGYGKLDLFATYGINEMFKTGSGPQFHPFTVGVTLVGF
ncbi:MAG: DUF2807 domain-containing protein [Bacteroidetes bacterium]|nr:DUF2807 domain-containing protein [Bacteroidota bacterium]